MATRKEIQRWNLVPLWVKRPQNLLGTVAVPNNFDVSGAIIDKRGRGWTGANQLVIDVDQGSWRVGTHG